MKSVSISPAPAAPCILLFIDNLLGSLFPFRQWATLRARVAFCLPLCPQIFQHSHHNRCSLSVCWMMPGWMDGPSKPGAKGAPENGPYQSLERDHWGEAKRKDGKQDPWQHHLTSWIRPCFSQLGFYKELCSFSKQSAMQRRQRCTKKSIVCSGGRILRYPLGPRCWEND